MVTSWSLFLDFWTGIRQNKKHRASAKQQFWSCPGYIKRVLLGHDAQRTKVHFAHHHSKWWKISMTFFDLIVQICQQCNHAVNTCSYNGRRTPIKVVKSLRLPKAVQIELSIVRSVIQHRHRKTYNLLFQSTWWHHDESYHVSSTTVRNKPPIFCWAHIISDKSEQWLNMNTWLNDFSPIWSPRFHQCISPTSPWPFLPPKYGSRWIHGFSVKKQNHFGRNGLSLGATCILVSGRVFPLQTLGCFCSTRF